MASLGRGQKRWRRDLADEDRGELGTSKKRMRIKNISYQNKVLILEETSLYTD